MFSRITLPINMHREKKDILGCESFKEQASHLMVESWDGLRLGCVVAIKQVDLSIEETTEHCLELIRNLLNVKNNDAFDVEALTLENISSDEFLDSVWKHGRKHPNFDNGLNPNHSHLFRMYMHERYDVLQKMVKESQKDNASLIKLPEKIDFKKPILLVSSNPITSHFFAKELHQLFYKDKRRTPQPIYVSNLSPYVRLLDFQSLFDVEFIKNHRGQVVLINFSVDFKRPLLVDLFDQFVMVKVKELAKSSVVILVNDNLEVYEHYQDQGMTLFNLNHN